ncbi:MAG: helix-turn-helix domain-containing protein [Mangrovicoccus sp.]|nr:helix-turn-helix domain-containing protein [Mangrovicoccus sp.]
MLFLAEMAARSGYGETHLPMSREDIADYLGLNAETVSRIMTRLRKSGLVQFQSPTDYTIPDMGAITRRLPAEILPQHIRQEDPQP